MARRRTTAADAPAPDRVLRAGRTCWRIERADRMAVIIDAADYFAHLKTAILSARQSILLIGWDFDTRIELDRSAEPVADVPNAIGALLRHVVRARPDLDVYVLRWDLAFLKVPARATLPVFLLDWLTTPRLRFRLDTHHPVGACHHQKIVVIDDALAFCGGIDVTGGRWDTRDHLDGDPRRVWPNGAPHGPWHDVTTAVDGAAARALGDLARQRWYLATGKRIAAASPGRDCWPDGLRPDFDAVEVAIARTEPAFDEQPEAREVEALLLAAIASAQRTIYLESQYFAAHRVGDALARRLAEADGPEIVIVNPERAEGWLEEKVMGSARALLLDRLRAADHASRLRFCTPISRDGTPIYVHAKVVVIDDTLLRVGSSNVNNRSMGLDTECDLAVEVRPGEPGEKRQRAAILQVRDSLLAEHFGLSLMAFRTELAAVDGALVAVLDRLMDGRRPTLVRFEPPALNDAELALAETAALDPDHPEAMSPSFLKLRGSRATLAVATGVAAAVGIGIWLRHRAKPRKPQ